LALLGLYAIIDRGTLDARCLSVRAFAQELRDGGARLIQYRDKVSGPQEVLRAAREIEAVFERLDAKLILNDRADLAAVLGWGCHVGQDDLSVEAVRRVVSGPMGLSTHNVKQVTAADLTGPDYVAVGPVFGTTSKLDAEPVIGLDGVRAARALTQRPLVTIGGITPENAATVREAGADSVAVIGALLPREGRSTRQLCAEFVSLLGG
jgi:thiamine-phosphate pyrophosphorylase